ncbi:MAG: methyltransferase domain-containing protein [Verrucomicrobia bacterium]|nr:methyltransferase domain-containing protein [Verrucomicrobiota bacterium]MBV8485848.1 methyltransferase domain-containing protein [Verrucomicrobiota bacterium]
MDQPIQSQHDCQQDNRRNAFDPDGRPNSKSFSELKTPDRSFDLTVCRHVIHSIPHPEKVIGELVRVTRSGGYLHLIAEDYGMLHFQRGTSLHPTDFWNQVPKAFAMLKRAKLLS